MIIRKVIKTGNSLAVTVPNIAIDGFNIKEGDLAQISINPSTATISYTFTGHPRQLALVVDKKKSKD